MGRYIPDRNVNIFPLQAMASYRRPDGNFIKIPLSHWWFWGAVSEFDIINFLSQIPKWPNLWIFVAKQFASRQFFYFFLFWLHISSLRFIILNHGFSKKKKKVTYKWEMNKTRKGKREEKKFAFLQSENLEANGK